MTLDNLYDHPSCRELPMPRISPEPKSVKKKKTKPVKHKAPAKREHKRTPGSVTGSEILEAVRAINATNRRPNA